MAREIVDCDLRYANDARRAVEAASPDLVVHLAAVGVTDPFLPIHDALRGNLEATINLIKAINGACKLIVTRTPTEYDLDECVCRLQSGGLGIL